VMATPIGRENRFWGLGRGGSSRVRSRGRGSRRRGSSSRRLAGLREFNEERFESPGGDSLYCHPCEKALGHGRDEVLEGGEEEEKPEDHIVVKVEVMGFSVGNVGDEDHQEDEGENREVIDVQIALDEEVGVESSGKGQKDHEEDIGDEIGSVSIKNGEGKPEAEENTIDFGDLLKISDVNPDIEGDYVTKVIVKDAFNFVVGKSGMKEVDS